MSERRNDAVRDGSDSDHRSAPQESQRSETTTGPTGERKPTVLVVEDRRPLVDAYVRWFGERFVVRTATSGPDALEQFDDTVDAVVLDRGLPGMTGDEVLRRLLDRGADCATIIISADEQDRAIRRLEYDRYFEKPVSNPAAIIAAIESLVDDRRGER